MRKVYIGSMAVTDGFSKQQQKELKQVLSDTFNLVFPVAFGKGFQKHFPVAFSKEFKKRFSIEFSEQFKEVVLPSLDKMSEDLDELKVRMGRLEAKVTEIDDKLGELKIEFSDMKRRLSDLENDTPSMRSFMTLKSRVEVLEKRLGVDNS